MDALCRFFANFCGFKVKFIARQEISKLISILSPNLDEKGNQLLSPQLPPQLSLPFHHSPFLPVELHISVAISPFVSTYTA